jgi:hypothetical protein
MYEDEIKIQEGSKLERYIVAKAFMMQHGAKIIDMYCTDVSMFLDEWRAGRSRMGLRGMTTFELND